MLRIPREVSSSWTPMSLRKLAMCAESMGRRFSQWQLSPPKFACPRINVCIEVNTLGAKSHIFPLSRAASVEV